MTGESRRLEDLCERITVGHVGKMSDQYIDGDGVVFLRSQDVRPFAIDTKSPKRVGLDFANRLAKSRLRTGDVVVVRTGYPGTAAVVPPELDGANCADLVVITPKRELDPHVLAAVFNSKFGQRLVSGRLVGAAQQHFNVSAAKALELELPPAASQRQIGTAVAQLCELIENNQRRIEILEEMARLIYKEWFVHFRIPEHEVVRLVDSELGPIPEGWEIRRLDAIASVVLGGTPSRKIDRYWSAGTVPWVTSSSVNKLRVTQPNEWITEEALAASNAKMVPARSTLIAITGATLGQVSFLEIDACTNQSVVAVTDQGGKLAQFIYLQMTERIGSLIAHASGSAQQHINKAVVSAFKVLVPPESAAADLQHYVGPLFDLIRNLALQNEILQQARDLLLPRLVSGELDVSQLDLELEAVG